MSKAARAASSSTAAPRCPRCSGQPAGSWGPPCHDCAVLGRAHRARQTDLAVAYARARRACTECDRYGWMLGPDGERLDLRCDHPTVAPEVWAGEATSAPPIPPPVEQAVHSGHEPPKWRPSPFPRTPPAERATA